MIASGLDWRMAIGALVLGNTIMGVVITVNGRIGAKVSIPLQAFGSILNGLLTFSSFTLRSRFLLVCRLGITPATSLSRLVLRSLSSGLGESSPRQSIQILKNH